jgi:hypothetical protein
LDAVGEGQGGAVMVAYGFRLGMVTEANPQVSASAPRTDRKYEEPRQAAPDLVPSFG